MMDHQVVVGLAVDMAEHLPQVVDVKFSSTMSVSHSLLLYILSEAF